MSHPVSPPHIYQRAVTGDSQDSLSIIASLVEPGQTLLDLGMGAGGLGLYLSQRQAIVADGVTLNQAEVDIAASWYRHVVVADLDQADLCQIFAGKQYDCIVCADVLEHLKAPENVLAQCKSLLKPGGRLIASVPNAGYCGLIAELIQGDFRYRPEGLLDNTHLRFFTRLSLQRFFNENGWTTQMVNTAQRSLLASEFRVAFDTLPPAVARYLLATRDALTYQFISVLQADAEPQSSASDSNDHLAQGGACGLADALFSIELYLATQGRYDEATKFVLPGEIGNPRQTFVFEIPASPEAYTHIRIDPADRPGFFRLHHLQVLLPSGDLLWQWHAGRDALAILDDAQHQQMLISAPWEMATGALLLLCGDDPWLEIPLESGVFKQVANHGARLEVCAGWPMSADFLQASSAVNALRSSQQRLQTSLQRELDQLKVQNLQLEQSRISLHCELEDSHLELQSKLENSRLELQSMRDDFETIIQEVRAEKQNTASELRAVQRERGVLLEQLNARALYLQSLEQSTLFRVSRPLVHFKMRLERVMDRSIMPAHQPMQPPSLEILLPPIPKHPVDIIVPVYRGLEDTRCCLESVLVASCQTPWRLIVINDCSPEPAVTEWLRAFAQRDDRITLLENTENLGFVATVNRGMTLSDVDDVLLLNSDAEVANDWLDRIQKAAYSAARVASVTPFSNNATICSYPRFCEGNELPSGYDTASLDRVFAQQLSGLVVEVPTAIGFCMYIRRQCLHDVGLFDVDNFGKGYGEENDFCVRAQQAGWVNLHTLDTFVRHAGGISFGDSKNARELQAMQTIRRLHPRYEADVQAFVARDPARFARMRIDIARITASGRPVILNVSHNREGGTLRHVREIAQHLSSQATFLRLTPSPGGVDLRLEGVNEMFALHFALPSEHPQMLETLRQLQVGHIHYHHLLGHMPDIGELPLQLGVTHDFTAHDYYSYCPQVSLTDHTDRYCGEQGLEQCHRCLERNRAPGNEGIESWRTRHARLLNQARYLIAPSLDTARRMHRFVPAANIQVVPHASLDLQPVHHPNPHPRVLPGSQPLKIVVLGALSKIKGADTLEEVAMLAARKNAAVEFHLIGYAYRSLCTQPKARLTVHGGYEEKDLPLLLQWLQPDAVWFPAQCPETYSFTLSASLKAGLPIVAPNIGAFAERLQKREWTWLCDWQQSASQWLDFFIHIREQHFCVAVSPGQLADPDSMSSLDSSAGVAPLEYRTVYLQELPRPVSPTQAQIDELQQQIETHLQYPGTVIKSVTLRTLIRLRATPVLSPITRLFPMHWQRRIKSWLQA